MSARFTTFRKHGVDSMDGYDLFRKLGVGAKFNFKRYQSDADKLKLNTRIPKETVDTSQAEDEVTRPELSALKSCVATSGSESDSDSSYSDGSPTSKRMREESDEEDASESELQILGSITTNATSVPQSKQQKKKQAKKKLKSEAQRVVDIHKENVNHSRKINRIHVYGTDIPDPIIEFDQLSERYSLHPKVMKNIQMMGFVVPTSIQMQAIPMMLERREILACAPTGSGKTLAFILPILHHLKEPRKLGFRALVLSPTRELAKQTYQMFTRTAEGLGFRIHFIEKASTAAKKFGPKSSKKFDILISTPNRLVHMLKHDPPLITLENVSWLIVDESDKLFEEGTTGFRSQLATIYKACTSKDVRRAMFSATFTHDVEQWCKLNLDNVTQVYIGAKNMATLTVKQELQFVGSESGKLVAMRNLIQKGLQPPVLVFIQSKERAKELFHELLYDGINVDVIHADRTQLQRDNVVKCFRSGQIWVLICTELMGRGMDFKGVNLVVNYDFPNSAISYIHRIGRTGRAGRQGHAVTYFTEDDVVNLRSIANVMRGAGCPVPEFMLELKKPNRKVRRKLANSSVARNSIRTIPQHELVRSKERRKKMNKKKVVTKSK